MFGLLAKLGTGLIGKVYKAADRFAFGGRLPGGAPQQRGTRPPMLSRVGPGIGGAVTGYAAGRMIPPQAPLPPPQAPLPMPVPPPMPGPSQQVPMPMSGQTVQVIPSNRTAILWISQYPVQPRGYVKNKSSYYRRDPQSGQTVHVPAGTVWRRRRRTNPLNPRAADRAIRRLEGTKRATRAFNRVTIKCRRCNRARCTCK